MNYFEIINKCLIELNYKPVTAFAKLTKNDYIRLKNVINRLNSDVVTSEPYWFRQKKTTITVDSDTEYDLTFDGKITDVFEDDTRYIFDNDYTHFYNDSGSGTTYGFYGGKLLFTPVTTSKTVTIYYVTNNPATDSTGVTEKDEMALETDLSIIPERYRESILINGSCMKFKGLVTHPKYQHWSNEYAKALSNMKAECLNTQEDKPKIVMGNGKNAGRYSTTSFNWVR